MTAYVRNAWYVAAWSHELEAGKPFPASILDEPIVIYRGESGRMVALEDRCVHRLAPLSLGRCEGDRLRCMYHGLLYDPDGAVAAIPGQDLIPKNARVKAYPVADRHDWVWVWMGDPAQADLALIPPAVGLSDPDYILGHGHLDYAAEAQLINDNLLDFSHLTYVHANSFGAGPEFAENLPRLEPLERGVRFSRWMVDTHGQSSRKSSVPIDSYMTYDFLIPGVLLMWSGNYPQGTAKKLDFAAPALDDAQAGVTFTSQAVTPLGPKQSRYFFSWGPRVGHGDEKLRDQLMTMAGVAFGEDKTMIEAQQKVIDRSPGARIMPTAHDKGVTIFTRLVERLAKAESSAASLPEKVA
uniref:aromatic ring-hydroxylating dioxygenase subunit alpha n=1 Tax=Altererythrobacter segetis TaxID=1104773 RepID=UPI00140D4C84|nr:aromatic ring-hydroxylating dioxygenase subunit alpha [Altererythrobacter segetis]